MNKNNFYFIVAAVLLQILLYKPAFAQSVCSPLKNIVSDAKNEFKNYRGSFDFAMDEYEGTERIGPLNVCKTDSGNGVASYSCSLDDLPDDLVNVKSIFNKLNEEIRQCFGTSIKAKIYGKAENRVEYDYLPERDDINLRYQRLTPQSRRRIIPPSYSIVISVDTVDLFKK